MIDKLEHWYLGSNRQSVYDTEELTALQLAGRTASKVNECVDVVNGYTSDSPFEKENIKVTNLKTFVVGDGVTDDTASFQKAIDHAGDNSKILFVPKGTYLIAGTVNITNKLLIMGCGFESIIKPINTSGDCISIKSDDVIFQNLKFEGDAPGVITVREGSKNIIFKTLQFKTLNERLSGCITLFNCSDIIVDSCYFDNTGYGILQRYNYVSNNVTVSNCIAKNMINDFVECNCTSTAPSKNWVIINCQFLGNVYYPEYDLERRFVGITGVENVVISNNIAEKSSGTACIHLEDVKGDITITSNILDNCVGSETAGQGYIGIYSITGKAKTCLISNNTFKRTDASLTISSVMDLGNAVFVNNILFTGNRIVGTHGNLNGITLSNQSFFSIKNNTFEGCLNAIVLTKAKHIDIVGNTFNECTNGIISINNSSSGDNQDFIVNSNKFYGTVEMCLNVQRNTSGTNPPTRWLVVANYFDKNAHLFDSVDCVGFANVVSNGYTIELDKVFYVGGARTDKKCLNYIFGDKFITPNLANADTSGASLTDLEIEVNEIKEALRKFGVISN